MILASALLLLCEVTFLGNSLGTGRSYKIYLETLKKRSSIYTDEENFSEAKLLCVDGLEMFTVNPARPEEVGASVWFYSEKFNHP